MPVPTIDANIKISFVFITLFRIKNSGSDSAVTAIIKARVVPIATPFSASALTSGMTPAAAGKYSSYPLR